MQVHSIASQVVKCLPTGRNNIYFKFFFVKKHGKVKYFRRWFQSTPQKHFNTFSRQAETDISNSLNLEARSFKKWITINGNINFDMFLFLNNSPGCASDITDIYG